MRSVGLYEAKTRLSELVAAVESGEKILLTRNGRPVAEIVPVSSDACAAAEAMAWIRSRSWSLEGASVRELIDEGRR